MMLYRQMQAKVEGCWMGIGAALRGRKLPISTRKTDVIGNRVCCIED
jgi:hypothetical protein